ncbi:g u mismatch-specific dna glycosylase [Fusarium sp. NRRL 52700]|nr:g u mismatch-specific dna glycosylase [Fusarium sp. NRRL 52700]
MKLLGLLAVCLPAVSAQAFWWTNSGWSKPADFNSQACESNPHVYYFCGTIAGTKGENPYPNAFPIRRDTCTLADTLGRGCHWKGAVGTVICIDLTAIGCARAASAECSDPPTKLRATLRLLSRVELKELDRPHSHARSRGGHERRLLWKSGYTDRRCLPEEDGDLPRLYATGNTNLVGRPSKTTSELSRQEMAEGTPVLEEKIKMYTPEADCFVGKEYGKL